MKKQSLLNTMVNNVNMEEAIKFIEEMVLANKKSYVVAVNVDVLVKIEKDRYLKEIFDNADLTIVDGKPLVWASKLYHNPIVSKVSGSDLVPLLCDYAEHKGYTVFFIGGLNGAAKRAKKNLCRKYKELNIVGTYEPPLGFESDMVEIEHINLTISEANPDILIVCFGCPKQEKWVYENYLKYDAKVSICAGATVDFLAGDIERAPKWISECGMEWLFRFFQEPRRLFKRYFVDDLQILKLLYKYRKQNGIKEE